YFLESMQGGEKWGRYSFIGLPCRTVLKVTGKQLRIEQNGQLLESHETDDPFAFIESFQKRYRIPDLPQLPRFNGGLVGYFGYDTVRYVEHRVANSTPPDTVHTPDIVLMVSEAVVVFDNLRNTLTLLVYADPSVEGSYDAAQAQLDAL